MGKTASIMEVANRLEKEYSRKLKVGFVNAMTLKRPEHVYRSLLELATEEAVPKTVKNLCGKTEAALRALKSSRLLVIDEVDFLLTKDQ
jgi:Cdc6-like AAA superfamily ATPase